MEYLEKGNLQNYLSKEFKILKWIDKIRILLHIINGLKKIHKKKIVHHDLHSGNILQDMIDSYITDLGLSVPADKTSSSEKNVFGVLPYVAPEVLRGL